MTDTGPRTEAGKRFYDELIRPTHPITVGMDYARQRITEIEAEARADVDGLVALRTYIEEQSLNPNWAKTIGAKFLRNRILDEIDHLLAGDKAENWDDFEPLELLAGGKAEAPFPTHDSDGGDRG